MLGALIGTVCFLAFNANGREIQGYDSQPAKYTALQLARGGTLTLDTVIAERPLLAERPGFGKASDHHWRSRYPLASAFPAALLGWILGTFGIIDLGQLFSANVIAKLSASIAVSVAVVLSYRLALVFVTPALAALVAIGFGLGTSLWPVASQTLSQHDLVLPALTLALWIAATPAIESRSGALAFSAALGVAVAARFQAAPAVLVLLLFAAYRRGGKELWSFAPFAGIVGVVVVANIVWFGHPLGGVAALERLHPEVHAVAGSFNSRPWAALGGLLVSPSRGLLVFSPVVLVAALGIGAAIRTGGVPLWSLAAAAAQTLLYSFYSVWWGGHAYGPRYMLDVLPLLLPAASLGVVVVRSRRALRIVGSAALLWSIAIAATGAFCYPAERWNTSPADVDRHHARLWDWRDPQFVRCWRTGVSPQNFDFFRPGGWPW